MVLYNSTSEEDWYSDQLIITWALLSSKVCSVPASSNLWRMPGLQFDPLALDDSETCFHAREGPIIGAGSLWHKRAGGTINVTSPSEDCGMLERERRISISPLAAPSSTPGATRMELMDCTS